MKKSFPANQFKTIANARALGTFGFCLEVKSLKIAEKVQKLIGEIVVSSTIPSQIWKGHDTLLNLRKATKKDFNRYRSPLK